MHVLGNPAARGGTGDVERVVDLLRAQHRDVTLLEAPSAEASQQAARDAVAGGAERIVAVHDELDIPFGTMRVKLGGGDNGHNGLKSLRSSLGTGDFHRVRIGVGRPPGRQEVADFLLSDYTAAERKEVPLQVVLAADAVESLLTEGLERTQQKFNS